MAEYAVVNKTQLDADMTSVADTIRTKGGTTEQLAWPDGYKTAVEAIQTGGGGSVLDNLFEVVETFTPAEDVMEHDFHFPKLGTYIIVADPPPSPEMAISRKQVLLESLRTQKTSDTTLFSSESSRSFCWTDEGKPDYWSYGATYVKDDIFTITPLYGKYPFRTDFTYYLLRCNW